MHRCRDWADLPSELVEIFMNKLDFPGLFTFGHICSSWRSVSSPIFKSMVESLLIIEEDSYDNGSVWIYNPLDGIPYQVRLPLGFTKGNICGSTNKKTLVLEEEEDGNYISFLHLFSSTAADAIHLLPLPIKCQSKKICLSSDQSMAMAIRLIMDDDDDDDEDEDACTFNIFICNTKHDLSWNHIEIPHSTNCFKPFVGDVIFSQGKFYAITTDRVIVIVHASLQGLATGKDYETLVSCAQAPLPLTYYDESLDYGLIYVTMAVAHQPKRRVSNIVLKSNDMDENYEYASKQFERAYDTGKGNHSVFVKCDHYRIILTQLSSNLLIFSP